MTTTIWRLLLWALTALQHQGRASVRKC